MPAPRDSLTYFSIAAHSGLDRLYSQLEGRVEPESSSMVQLCGLWGGSESALLLLNTSRQEQGNLNDRTDSNWLPSDLTSPSVGYVILAKETRVWVVCEVHEKQKRCFLVIARGDRLCAVLCEGTHSLVGMGGLTVHRGMFNCLANSDSMRSWFNKSLKGLVN